MNVGCSKSVLVEGLKRIEAAVLELDIVSKVGINNHSNFCTTIFSFYF